MDESIFGFGQWNTSPVKFTLKDHSKTYVVHTARKIPIPLQAKVKKTLDKMVNDKIIEKISHPTEWVSPIVPVMKANKEDVRICVDYKKLNNELKREIYPIPTFEELSSKFSGTNTFSKLDAASGFYQIPIDEASKDLTAFITPSGRYRFLRLPMGVNIAPEIFQRKMIELTEGLDGVICYLDDIIVFGESPEKHDENLKVLLEKIKNCGLKLNKQKCSFRTHEVQFLGHVITKEGIKIDPDKVAAIKLLHSPKNIDELRKVLGMINFLTKFVPNAQEIMSPMNELLRSDVIWKWTDQQEKSFDKIKKMLC